MCSSDLVLKGVVSPMRTVPAHIPRPPYAETGRPPRLRHEQDRPRGMPVVEAREAVLAIRPDPAVERAEDRVYIAVVGDVVAGVFLSGAEEG